MDSELYGSTLKNTFHYNNDNDTDTDTGTGTGTGTEQMGVLSQSQSQSVPESGPSLQSVDVEYNLVRNLMDSQQLQQQTATTTATATGSGSDMASGSAAYADNIESNVVIQELLHQFGVTNISDFQEVDEDQDEDQD